MPKLLVEKGQNKGASHVLDSGAEVTIGREPGCAFVINDSNISRKHCTLSLKGGAWFVKDLASRNGTYLNGKRLTIETRIAVGDRLQVGEMLISFLDEKEGNKEGGLIGMRVGGYRIMERLGRGGMGTVYKANQIALNREVALKVLSQDLLKEDVFKNLFIAEARAAAALNHPNIVQVHDVGCESSLYYFSMEFMPNGSVHDLLTREGRIPAKRALRLAMDAAAGLSYAERKGIVHRDIKPENLMIADTGAIKIGDLGLALNMEKGDAEDQVGMMGTPHYCAPEQVTRGKIDQRTDLYALGATMYRMMAGRPPYTGTTLKEILVKKVKEKAIPLTEVVPGLPSSVSDIVMQLLEKDPSRRPGSAEELRGRIDAILPEVDGLSGGSTTRAASSTPAFQSSTSIQPPTSALPGRPRTGALIAWLGVACLFLAGAIGIFIKVYLNKTSTSPIDNGKPAANNGNGNPVNPGESAEARAARDLVAAQNWIDANPAEVKTKAGMEKALGLYQAIVEKYAGTPVAELAQRDINGWKEKLFQFEGNAALKKAEAVCDAANRTFQESGQTTDFEEVIRRFENVGSSYATTEAGAQARERAAEVRKWLTGVQSAAEAWDKANRESLEAIASGRYSRALVVLSAFLRDHPDSGYDARANEGMQKAGEMARASYERYVTVPLKPLEESKSWPLALKALEEARERFSGLRDLEDRISQERTRIEGLARKVETPETVDNLKLEAEALTDAAEMIRLWNFDGAMKKLKAAAAAIKDDADAMTRLQQEVTDCDLMLTFKTALMAHANGNDGGGTGLAVRDFAGSRLNGASDNGLTVEGSGEIPWERVQTLDVFKLAIVGWNLSGREAIGLGILCLKAHAHRCARHAFATARHRDSALASAARLYEDRSHREERSRIPTNPLGADLFQMAEKEREACVDAQDRVIKSLVKQKDFMGQAIVYSCMQDFEKSTELFNIALKEQSLSVENEWRVRVWLMTNAIMEGNDAARESNRSRAMNLYPDSEHAPRVYEADEVEKHLPATLARIDELRMLLFSRPDPDSVAQLLKKTDTFAHFVLDRRIIARWLCEHETFKRHEIVKSGDALAILAMSMYEMKDYFEAKRMFERLRRNFPKHEWCRSSEGGERKVDDYWSRCTSLIKQHNLGR